MKTNHKHKKGNDVLDMLELAQSDLVEARGLAKSMRIAEVEFGRRAVLFYKSTLLSNPEMIGEHVVSTIAGRSSKS